MQNIELTVRSFVERHRQFKHYSRSTFERLEQALKNIMSAVNDFATAVNAYNAQTDAAITDITTEIAALNAEVTTLQNSPGTLSAADQASLDAIQTHAQSVVAKLQALDAINAPPGPKQP